jgi:hypothetical protein
LYLSQDSQVDEGLRKDISFFVSIAIGRSRRLLLESRLQEVLIGRVVVRGVQRSNSSRQGVMELRALAHARY